MASQHSHTLGLPLKPIWVVNEEIDVFFYEFLIYVRYHEPVQCLLVDILLFFSFSGRVV